MIVLDTNVISEMTKAAPSEVVAGWLDAQSLDTLYITPITIAEIRYGILTMDAGRRRQALDDALSRTIQLFADRLLPFDAAAALCYAELAARARAAGRGFPTPDGYIAGIAVSRGYSVASRDIASFEAAGVSIINPWKTES